MRRPGVRACEEYETVLSALHSFVQLATKWIVSFSFQLLPVPYPIFFRVIDCIAPNVSLLHNPPPGVGYEISARVDVLKLSHIIIVTK